MATESRGPSARARSRARSSRLFCSGAWMVSRWIARPGDRGHDRVGRMRRQHRHRPPALRDGLLLGALDLVGRHDARRRQPVEHAIARGARGGDGAIRPADFRRLRQRDQQRGFRERQPPRLLAEIGERCGADAFEIAAIGREAEVEREDLVLAQRALELDRAHHLAKLGDEAPLAARLQQPRHLHGQRRGARHDAAVGDQLR